VSQPSGGTPPYRVVFSGLCRETTTQLLERARAKGRLAEVAQAVRGIETRLLWVPLDFGEPRRDLVHLGVQLRSGTVPPLVVRYAVDEARRIVYVTLPFELLPRTGLEAERGR
jgi:hypothetical protein